MKQNMNELSKYLCYLLRHKPEEAGLDMDTHGWVSVEQLITGVCSSGKYELNRGVLEKLVTDDKKGRYRFDDSHEKIKCCQGHSIEWVEPELEYREPPQKLYHGTTEKAFALIKQSGAIKKMKRHAVHMQADINKAWQSAERWHDVPVVLEIDASAMAADGYGFGVSENEVWCTGEVPVKYIIGIKYSR